MTRDEHEYPAEAGTRRCGRPLPTIALVVAAIAVVFSLKLTRPLLLERQRRQQETGNLASGLLIEKALRLEHSGLSEAAFLSMQAAIQEAASEEQRIEAAVTMGEFLVARAERAGGKYGLMARQYLDVATDLTNERDQLLRAFRGIIMCSRMDGDPALTQKAFRKAWNLAPTDTERIELLLIQSDALMSVGTWPDFKDILAKAAPYEDHPEYAAAVKLRHALIEEQILARPALFDEWSADSPEPDKEKLLSDLTASAQARFTQVTEMGRGVASTEALFRLGRFAYERGEYDRARSFLDNFIRQEPDDHHPETLLMMISMACASGETYALESMLGTYLKRFHWNTAVGEELLRVVDLLSEKGMEEEALSMLRKYLPLPSADELRPEFLLRAGRLAAVLDMEEDAHQFFAKLFSDYPDGEASGGALIETANIYTRNGNAEAACRSLLQYLSIFPFGKRSADAMFGLSDIAVSTDAPLARTVSYALTATSEHPNDPRTPEALMMIGNLLEELDLAALALPQYSKASLLCTVASSPSNAPAANALSSHAAVLASARCLLKDGDTFRADSMLRTICNSNADPAIRSEAAHLWAATAMKQNQFHEARRRLAMVQKGSSTDDMAREASMRENILRLKTADKPLQVVGDLLQTLDETPAGSCGDLILNAYQAAFEVHSSEADIEGMRAAIVRMDSSPHSKNLPMDEFYFELLTTILVEDGIQGFADAILQNGSGMPEAEDLNSMKPVAEDILRNKAVMDKFLRVGARLPDPETST